MDRGILIGGNATFASRAIRPMGPISDNMGTRGGSRPVTSHITIPRGQPLPRVGVTGPALRRVSGHVRRDKSILHLVSRSRDVLNEAVNFSVRDALLVLCSACNLDIRIVFVLLRFYIRRSHSSATCITGLNGI